MAIEIRELVIKATIIKSLHQPNTEFVQKNDLRRFKREILDEAEDKFRRMLDDMRDRR